ncbi:MAG: metallophosphoesterase family protein [Solirubrobacteraceae bacterium]|nr:metallophosphoesterase family protein [Solirubrobacteraceae bacterium]
MFDRRVPSDPVLRLAPPACVALVAALVLLLAGPGGATASASAPSSTPDRVVLSPTAAPERSQTFVWRTDAATTDGRVELRPEAGGPTTVRGSMTTGPTTAGAEGGSGYAALHHAVTVDGLAPDTAYRYRVGSDAGWSAWRTLRTAQDPAGPIRPWRWLYLGDAQNGLDREWPVNVRRAYDAVPDARVVLHAGDMINHPTHDVEWHRWFAAQGDVPATRNALVTPGNHEYLYGFLESVDPDAARMRAHFRPPANGPAGQVGRTYVADHQDVRFVVLDTGLGLDLVGLALQGIWLDRVLAESPRRWTVVMFHYPVYSAGIQGGLMRSNPQVRGAWGDILERHDVDLVLQGHDHAYSRGYLRADGPVYVVSVLGPKHYDLTPDADNDWTRSGATRVTAAGGTSTFQAICMDGDRLVLESVVAARDDDATTTRAVGETLDAFTIDRSAGGKRVVEGGTCVGRASATGPAADAATSAGGAAAGTAGAGSATTGGPAAQRLRRCARRAVLVTGVRRGARQDVVTGAAEPRHAGRRVRVTLRPGGRTVGRTTVRRDGTFTVRVPSSARSRGGAGRSATRYRATVGGRSSPWVLRDRRIPTVRATRRGGRVTASGRIARPVGRGVRVTVQARVDCGRWRTASRATTRRDGSWRVRLPARSSRPGVAVRAVATVPTRTGQSVRAHSLPTIPR